mgnify:CR=1 FL=1|jgi:hypothetical protein
MIYRFNLNHVITATVAGDRCCNNKRLPSFEARKPAAPKMLMPGPQPRRLKLFGDSDPSGASVALLACAVVFGATVLSRGEEPFVHGQVARDVGA